MRRFPSFLLLVVALIPGPVAAEPPYQYALGADVGSGDDGAFGLDVDVAGSAWACGTFRDSLALSSGLLLAAGGLGQDAVVVRRDPSGAVAWARAGGSADPAGLDVAHGVAVDGAGNAFVAGAYAGAGPSSFGAFTIAAGGPGAFLVRYGPGGGEVWAVSLVADATAWDVAVDDVGQAWVAGSGAAGAWVKRIDAANGAVLGTWDFAGLAFDEDTNVSIAPGGDVVLSGSFADTIDFDPGAGALPLLPNGASDGFIARYAPSGAPAWAYALRSIGADAVFDHAVDTDGNVTLCGQLAAAGSLNGVGGGVGFVVARVSPVGAVGFMRNVHSQFAGFNSALEARRIAVHDPGAYTIAGVRRQAFGTIGGVALPAESHFHLVQYSAAGAVQWVKFIKSASIAASLPEPKALRAGAGDALHVAGRVKETVTFDAIALADVNGSSKWALFTARLGTPTVAVAPPVGGGLALRAGPNPFSAATTLEFTLAAEGEVTLELRDVRGRRARLVPAGRLGAGPQRLRLDAAGLPAGLWFAVLTAPDGVRVARVVRVRGD